MPILSDEESERIISQAKMYETGIGAEKDPREAARLYIIADLAGAEYARELFRFSFEYYENMEVTTDRFEVLLKAAEMGYVKAQYAVGGRYREGITVFKDYKKARYWLSKAADQDHSEALYYLAAMYAKGRGVKQDVKRSERLIRRAAELGDKMAKRNLAKLYTDEPGKTFRLLSESAEAGDAESCYLIGTMYRDAKGIEHDSANAIEWFEKAAQLKFKPANYALGLMYETGYDDLEKDISLAIAYFERSFEQQNYAAAAHHLGIIYENGTDVRPDPSEAFRWFSKSAEMGFVPGMMKMRDYYNEGIGVEKDENMAKEWQEKTKFKYDTSITKAFKKAKTSDHNRINNGHKGKNDKAAVRKFSNELKPDKVAELEKRIIELSEHLSALTSREEAINKRLQEIWVKIAEHRRKCDYLNTSRNCESLVKLKPNVKMYGDLKAESISQAQAEQQEIFKLFRQADEIGETLDLVQEEIAKTKKIANEVSREYLNRDRSNRRRRTE